MAGSGGGGPESNTRLTSPRGGGAYSFVAFSGLTTDHASLSRHILGYEGGGGERKPVIYGGGRGGVLILLVALL